MTDNTEIEPTPLPPRRVEEAHTYEPGLERIANLVQDAKAATEAEQTMTLWQGIKVYPKAIGWSILISTCICMEGYDVSLINNFYAFPQFNMKYGEQLADGTWQVSPAWQAGLSNGAVVGEIFGLLINGWASERFGYR